MTEPWPLEQPLQSQLMWQAEMRSTLYYPNYYAGFTQNVSAGPLLTQRQNVDWECRKKSGEPKIDKFESK